jgi:hypothetical protein
MMEEAGVGMVPPLDGGKATEGLLFNNKFIRSSDSLFR